MEFEVFDRNNDKKLRVNHHRMLIDIPHRRIRFSKGIMDEMGLAHGDHIRFLRNGETWFVTKGHKETGYLLLSETRAGLRTNCIQTARAIMMAYKPGKMKWEFLVKKSSTEFEGSPIYKLIPVIK